MRKGLKKEQEVKLKEDRSRIDLGGVEVGRRQKKVRNGGGSREKERENGLERWDG